MNKLISFIRRRLKARQEHRLLVLAMRNAPIPTPSEGLKQRLLADAAGASRRSFTRASRPRLLWAVPAIVLAVAVMGVVWSVNSHRDEAVHPTKVAQKPASVRSDTHLVKPAGRHDIKVIAPVVRKAAMLSTANGHTKPHRYPAVSPQQPQRVNRVVALRRIASVPPYTPLPAQMAPTEQHIVELRQAEPFTIRSMSKEDERRYYTISQMGSAIDIPSINLSIGHAEDDVSGYAYASAWSTDKDGHRVKTEWSITDDAYAQRTQEEVAISGSSPTPSLTVTVVTSLRRDE